MSLQTRVDCEAARSGVHARHVLAVVDLLQAELLSVVPMLIVHVLSEERVRLHGTVRVHFGHVHIVDEVDEALGARRTVVAARFLLQRLLQDALKHFRGRVEVERHVDDQPVFGELVHSVVDEHRLAGTSVAYKHHWSTFVHEQVHEIANTSGFVCVHQCGLVKFF